MRANVLELFAFVIISSATFVASFIRFYQISNIPIVEALNYTFIAYEAFVLILSYVCYKPFYDIFFFRNIMKVGASVER